MGRKKGGANKGGQNRNNQNQGEVTVEVLKDWADINNPYYKHLYKKIRNMKKKLDKMYKFQKMKAQGEELNSDQLNTLSRLKDTRTTYNEVVRIANELEKVQWTPPQPTQAPVEQIPEEKQAVVAEAALATAKPLQPKPTQPPKVDNSQKEAKTKSPAAPKSNKRKSSSRNTAKTTQPKSPPQHVITAPAIPQEAKVNALLELFHVSHAYTCSPPSQKTIISELKKMGIDTTSEELNGLKTLASYLSGQVCEEGSSPEDKFRLASEQFEQYLAKSPEILAVAGVKFNRLRIVAQAVLKTSCWKTAHNPQDFYAF